MAEAQGLTEGPLTIQLVGGAAGEVPDVEYIVGFHLFADPSSDRFGVRDGTPKSPSWNAWQVPLSRVRDVVTAAQEPDGFANLNVDLEMLNVPLKPSDKAEIRRAVLYVQKRTNRIGVIVEGSRVFLPLDRALTLLKKVAS